MFNDTDTTELFDTTRLGTDLDTRSADALTEDLDAMDFRPVPTTFGLKTGRFRGPSRGRFVDGSPPEDYDSAADRFRDAPSGRFNPAPNPVERPDPFDVPTWWNE